MWHKKLWKKEKLTWLAVWADMWWWVRRERVSFFGLSISAKRWIFFSLAILTQVWNNGNVHIIIIIIIGISATLMCINEKKLVQSSKVHTI